MRTKDKTKKSVLSVIFTLTTISFLYFAGPLSCQAQDSDGDERIRKIVVEVFMIEASSLETEWKDYLAFDFHHVMRNDLDRVANRVLDYLPDGLRKRLENQTGDEYKELQRLVAKIRKSSSYDHHIRLAAQEDFLAKYRHYLDDVIKSCVELANKNKGLSGFEFRVKGREGARQKRNKQHQRNLETSLRLKIADKKERHEHIDRIIEDRNRSHSKQWPEEYTKWQLEHPPGLGQEHKSVEDLNAKVISDLFESWHQFSKSELEKSKRSLERTYAEVAQQLKGRFEE